MRQHVFASGAILRSRSRALLCAALGIVRALLTDKSPRILAACIGAVLIASVASPVPLGAAQSTAQQQAAAKAAAEAAAKAAAKAAAEAAAKAAAKLAAQQAAAKAAQQAAQQAAQKAAQQAAQKAAQAAAQKAAQQAAAAKAEAERQKQQQQAAAKAAAERQKQQQQQQQAAAKAEAERQKQQQAAAKAEADRQKQLQQQSKKTVAAPPAAQQQVPKAGAPSQQPVQKAVSVPQPPQKAAAPPASPPQQIQKSVTAPQPQTQKAVAAPAPQPPKQPQIQKAGGVSQPPQLQVQKPTSVEASASAPPPPPSSGNLQQPPAQPGSVGQTPAAPPPDVKTQQTQIDELLRHAEQAAVERRRQRQMLEELRRREAQKSDQQTPVVQLGDSPAAAASAQAQQSAQIEEIRQQLIRAELGRNEERKRLEELKRRQQQIVAAQRPQQQAPVQQSPGQQGAGEPAPAPAAQPDSTAQQQTEMQRLQTDISELQRKQERWDERRLARSKRIEELIALQKARAEEAKQRAEADQGKAVVPTAPERLEAMQQQARWMALGHPDAKPSAPQLEPVKLDTALPPQAQPATGALPAGPAAGAEAGQGESSTAKPDQPKPGAAPASGGQDTPAAQTPAGDDAPKQDGAAKEPSTPPATSSDVTTAPAAPPSDKPNSWQPEVVAGDGSRPVGGPFGGVRDRPFKGWHPEIVTATIPPQGKPNSGSPNSGTNVAQPPPGNSPAPQQGGGETSTPPAPASDPAKAEAAPAPAAPKADDPKAEPVKRDRGKPPRGLPPVMGNIPAPQAEILATNMGPAEFKKARELGLEPVEPTHLRNLGMKLTRLRVPRGANAAALRRKLAQQMPLGGFADNQTYWIFGAVRGGDGRSMFGRLPERPDTRAGGGSYSSSATGDAPAGADSADTTDGSAASAGATSTEPVTTADPVTTTEPAAADSSVASTDSSSSESTAENGAATTEEAAAEDGSETAETASKEKENKVAARSDDNKRPDRAPDVCKGERCFANSLIKWHNDLRSCTKDVKVGIIDTSFDISHPTFRRMKGSSGEFLNGEAPSTHDWHGTAVLSLLAGDPASATPGLIPDASFYLATAFKTDDAGNASTDTMRLLQALDWLDALDVRYINMSFSGPRDPLFEQAINRMVAKGTVFIAAAGNQGPTAPPSYPAAYPQVIAVTAVNRNAENYRHANRGPYVDLSAPGVEIMTALPDGKQGFRTGTSFAAPFVTAIVATRSESPRALSRKSDLLSSLNLQDLGPPGPDPIYGQGLALAPKVCKGSGGVIARKDGSSLPQTLSAGAAMNVSRQ